MRCIFIFLLMIFFTGQGEAGVLKIATLSPDGTQWMRVMRESARQVAKQTDNQVKIKFYPGGVMGGDSAVLRKIRLGQLHGGAFVSGSLAKFYSDNLVYNLPLLFNSYREVDYVRKRMDPIIIEGLERKGFVTFGLAEAGFAYLMSKEAVGSIEDLQRQKVWIPDNDETSEEILKVFGVTPIPLSLADVRAALQTGLVNTVTTSPIGAIALQWHTQINYLTNIPLFYIYGMLAVERKAFSKFSPEHQTILREVMGKAFRKIDRQNRDDNEKALAALRKQGVQFIQPSQVALNRWEKTASDTAAQMIRSGHLSKDIVDTIAGHKSNFRSQN